MNLKRILIASFALLSIGSVLSFAIGGVENGLWFACGGGLTLVNFFFAVWVVKFGLRSLKSKGMMMGLLLMKSMTFLALIAVILMVVKPLILPFTLGISVVIVGALVTALVESRRISGAPK